METRIRINPGSREAASAASGALEIFRAETRDLSPFLAGVSVNLTENPGTATRSPDKTVGVRVDFRRGGHYLSETHGRDWQGLVPDAAVRAVRGARAVLEQRWELQEGRP